MCIRFHLLWAISSRKANLKGLNSGQILSDATDVKRADVYRSNEKKERGALRLKRNESNLPVKIQRSSIRLTCM